MLTEKKRDVRCIRFTAGFIGLLPCCSPLMMCLHRDIPRSDNERRYALAASITGRSFGAALGLPLALYPQVPEHPQKIQKWPNVYKVPLFPRASRPCFSYSCLSAGWDFRVGQRRAGQSMVQCLHRYRALRIVRRWPIAARSGKAVSGERTSPSRGFFARR